MGCALDRHRKEFKYENGGTDVPTLTKEEVKLLKESWCHIKEDVEKVGVITFIGLFETHPEVQDTFLPFRKLSKIDMEGCAILRSHGLRVMGIVDKSIARVSRLDKFIELTTTLGARHFMYKAKAEYIDLVGEQFIIAIKTHMDDAWSQDLEHAWLKLFRLISHHMANGMRNAS